MAITNIKRVINNSRSYFVVRNHHHPSDTNDPSSQVAPDGFFIHDMWVPWCFGQGDFNAGQFISITSGKADNPGAFSFTIWQHDCPHLDGDQVRFSTDGAFHDCDIRLQVPGESVAGGDRKVTISGDKEDGSDATILFEEA